MKHPERLIAVTLACALLAACGGGGDSPAPVPGPAEVVPASASESSVGLVKYLTDLFAASADTKEPVDLGTFAPKTPDDTEPEPIS
jgi:hypothetical protein